MGQFVEVCRRGLKVNADKSKVMVMNGAEGLECKVYMDVIGLEHVSEFKYLGGVLDESGTCGAEYSRKVRSGRIVPGAIRSFLVNARDLQLECVRILHETVCTCSYVWQRDLLRKEKRSRIRTVDG